MAAIYRVIACRGLAYFVVLTAVTGTTGLASSLQSAPSTSTTPDTAFIQRHCVTCHNDRLQTGNLSLEQVDIGDVAANPGVWEKVIRNLRAGARPPQPRSRPDEASTARLVSYLETSLDASLAASPNPGRTDTFRRLNRTEYQNAIRDLLDLDIAVTALLPVTMRRSDSTTLAPVDCRRH